MLVYFASHL